MNSDTEYAYPKLRVRRCRIGCGPAFYAGRYWVIVGLGPIEFVWRRTGGWRRQASLPD